MAEQNDSAILELLAAIHSSQVKQHAMVLKLDEDLARERERESGLTDTVMALIMERVWADHPELRRTNKAHRRRVEKLAWHIESRLEQGIARSTVDSSMAPLAIAESTS